MAWLVSITQNMNHFTIESNTFKYSLVAPSLTSLPRTRVISFHGPTVNSHNFIQSAFGSPVNNLTRCHRALHTLEKPSGTSIIQVTEKLVIVIPFKDFVALGDISVVMCEPNWALVRDTTICSYEQLLQLIL